MNALLLPSSTLIQVPSLTVTTTETVRVTGVSCLGRTPELVYCDYAASVFAICSAGQQAAPCWSLWPALAPFCQATMTAVPISATVVGPVSWSTVVVTVSGGTTTIAPT